MYGTFNSPTNNYFASVGSSVQWQLGGVTNPCNGVFGYGGPALGSRDVRDGTSSTIAFAEWRTGDNNANIRSIQDAIEINTINVGAATDDPSNNMPYGGALWQAYISQCAALATTAPGRSWIAQRWDVGMFGRALGNTLMAPNSPYPNCNKTTGNGDFDNLGVFGMSSFHSGGGNVALCDGSVRFLKQTTALQTIWALGSRAQGEAISQDSY